MYKEQLRKNIEKGVPKEGIRSDCNADQIVSCKGCWKTMKSSSYTQHLKICFFKETIQSSKAHTFAHIQKLSPTLSTLFGCMLDDEIGKALKKDPLIIKYAEKKIKEKVDTSVRSWQTKLKSYLRLMGRFLNEAQKEDPKSTMTFLLSGTPKFDSLIQYAVRAAGGNEEQMNTEAATIPGRIGNQLKNLLDFLEELALDEPKSLNRSEKIKDIKELRRLFELKWNNEVTVKGAQILQHKNRTKSKALPSLEEIMELSRYLVKELATAVKIQKENPSRYISHFLTAYFLIIIPYICLFANPFTTFNLGLTSGG